MLLLPCIGRLLGSHAVFLVRTHDSEDRIASIITVTRIGELVETSAVTSVLRLVATANIIAGSPIVPISYTGALLSTLLHLSLIPISYNRSSAYQLQRSATEHSSTCKSRSHKPQQA
jgi:hypothetical protein